MKQQAIEIEKLTESEILGMMDETAQLSWDDVLVFRQFTFHKRIFTVIVRPDGKLVSVEQPTKKLINEFGKQFGICAPVLDACWQVLGIKRAKACVMEKFKLISTRGVNCTETAWVMIHQMDTSVTCADDGYLCIRFKSGVRVKLDLPKSIFQRRVKEAKRCGTLQHLLLKQFELNHGVGDGDGKSGRYDDEHYHLKSGNANLMRFGIRFIMNIYQAITKEMFNERVDEEELRAAVTKVLGRTYLER